MDEYECEESLLGNPSSQTQGQLVGEGKSLNGREKNLGEK